MKAKMPEVKVPALTNQPTFYMSYTRTVLETTLKKFKFIPPKMLDHAHIVLSESQQLLKDASTNTLSPTIIKQQFRDMYDEWEIVKHNFIIHPDLFSHRVNNQHEIATPQTSDDDQTIQNFSNEVKTQEQILKAQRKKILQLNRRIKRLKK